MADHGPTRAPSPFYDGGAALTLREAQQAEATERAGLAYCEGEIARLRLELERAIGARDLAAERVQRAAWTVNRATYAAVQIHSEL